VVVVVAACFVLLVLLLRYWLLPDIERYREDIALAISQASGQSVTIGGISAEWEGLHPYMMLRMIQVHDDEGNTTLLLHRLEGTLSWLSILHGNFHFREIEINQPDLIVRRDTTGVIHVAGFALNTTVAKNENGFSDWLLRQRRVTINNANILWQDDLRGAPELELLVNLRLESRGHHHRFGILAVPPAGLATRMDMRGDLIGESLDLPDQWRGRLFVQIDQADIASWYAWLPMPQQIKLHHGAGTLRMWVEIDGMDIKKLSADMRLHNVRAQLAEGLPELDLVRLQGKAGWKKIREGKREGDMWYTRQLYYAMRGKRGLEPVNFSLHVMPAHAEKTGSGRANVTGLNLEILGDLVEYLPISQALRERVSRASPRGDVQSLLAQWSGEWMDPVRFNVRGRFSKLSMSQTQKLPSFSGITGNIDITERGGTLSLNSQNAKVVLPDVFGDPLMLDTLTGQASWSLSGNSTLLKFSNISFSNGYATGLAYGTYQVKHGGADTIDLVGQLAHADARYLAHHIPELGVLPRDLLDNSVLEGKFSDVRLHLKGDLKDFPFAKKDTAIFRAQAKASGVTLDNLPGWPRIENVSGNLLLHGSRMEFDATQAYIAGTRLSKAQLHIADMTAPDAVLLGQIEAGGATQQFLNIAKQYGDGDLGALLPDSITITGDGRLSLKLGIPIFGGAARLAGSYQLIDNQLDFGSRMPSLKSINGILGFNNSGIKIENMAARLLGGPIVINAAGTSDGGFHLAAAGTLNLGNTDEIWEAGMTEVAPLLTRHLRGSTAWRASVRVGDDKLAKMAFESSLQGVASSFPEPFSKSSSDVVPLRLERIATGPGRDEVSMSYGGRATAKMSRVRTETGDYKTERGVVTFGAPSAALPVRAGITVMGALPILNLDQWLGQLKQSKSQSNAEAGFSTGLTGINIQLGALDFLGRRLTDVTLNASKEDGLWRSTVAGKDINGNINWDPTGRGRIVARLNRLVVPSTSSMPGAPTRQEEKDLPALDVMAENFSIGGKDFGQLELLANHQEQNWRIEKLHMATTDSSVSVRGVWDKHTTVPRTQLGLIVESNNIGKFLTRLGHPERVKRGSGKLEGTFSWNGGPQSIDYATLYGSFKINARQGQFPKFEPGIGRLFGIFDLRTLPRRIILDFHDVFSEGFGFNDIIGDIKVSRGIAVIEDLKIEGPAARVSMTGQINLEAETQDLHMTVTPSFGLATPVVGVASIIVSKAFQKPTTSTATSNEYNITGSWADPLVTKTSGDTTSLEERSP